MEKLKLIGPKLGHSEGEFSWSRSVLHDSRGRTVASISGFDYHKDYVGDKNTIAIEEAEDYVKLFIAAPELLKTVEEYYDFISSGGAIGYSPEKLLELKNLLKKAGGI